MSTAQKRWEKLNSQRSGVLDRARQCAELTIPAMMPPEGSDENTNLPTPYQSLGARGVNNLASKMLLALMPPSTPFFRLKVDPEVLAELGASKESAEEAMRRIENRGMSRMESGNHRVMLHTAIKHMIVTGNALVHMPEDGGSRMYRLNQYVVVRDPQGNVTEAIIKEGVHPSTLPEDVRAACQVKDDADATKSDKACDVYTTIQLEGGKHVYWQEINDIEVPGSRGRSAADETPFIFLRWQAVENEDYGRGLVEEYLGDLRSLEGLSKAIVGFSAVAAKIVFLLKPNSTTDEDALVDAETGDLVEGKLDDIGVLQLDKYADFRVAKGVIDDLILRLSHAFLLQSGTVRHAERVTAEEIRAQAQELEDVLGGVYTVQAQELQLPVVRRLIAQMKAGGQFPTLPKIARKAITPVIITGFEALGRGHELNRYRSYFADGVSLFGPGFMEQFDQRKVAQVLATQRNVDIADLLKTKDELAADARTAQAAAVGQAVVDKATGPVAGAAANAVADQVTNGGSNG